MTERTLAEIGERLLAESRQRDAAGKAAGVPTSAELAEIRKRREREAQLAAANLPLRHVKALETLTPAGPWQDAYDRLQTRIGTGCLVALVGGHGTGKTLMASATVRRAILDGTRITALFATATELFLMLKATFRDGSGVSEEAVLKRFRDPQLLVLDEAHERAESAWESRVLSHIINSRYADMKDTILISNQTPDAMEDSLGPGITDRLQETGGVMVCDWPSFRQPR